MITVAIASYNYERYIIRLLESIQKQTFTDYEVIIVDDASSDNSVEKIKKFIENNPQMTIKLYVNETNSRIAYTRNRALEMAQGEYIMFCDSDDWMEPDCLQILSDNSEMGKYDRVVSEVREVDESGKVLQVQHFANNPSKWICGLHHGSIYKTAVFKDNNLFFKEVGGFDDFYITSMFHSYCDKVKFVKKSIYNWYNHTDSFSASTKEGDYKGTVEQFGIIVDALSELPQRLDEHDREMYIYQLLKLYCVCIYHSGRYLSLKDKIRLHTDLHERLKEYYPQYNKNKYICLSDKSPARKYARLILYVTIKAENLKVINLILACYHLVSYFHYFNI